MSTKYDKLFEHAKSNAGYFKELTKELIEMGKKMAISIIQKNGLRYITVDDVEDYILDIIWYIYANYDEKETSFSEFSKYVMYKRLVSKMIDSYVARSMVIGSLDDVTDDGTPILELIEDTNLKHIPDDISFDEAHLKICSPKSSDSNTQRTKKRVYNLINAGYSSKEIKKFLKINESQLRYLLKLINEDIKNVQNKIDCK